MRTLLVIEEADGEDICGESAEVTLLGVFEIRRAPTVERALTLLSRATVDALLITLPMQPPAKRSFWPWKRQPSDDGLGWVGSALDALRSGGHHQLAIVYELPARHLHGLRERYGDVRIVSSLGIELRDALGQRHACRDELVRFGDQISRTLRNSDRGVPKRMVDMFLRDVYGDAEQPSASQRFAQLDPGDFELAKAHDMFAVIDSMKERAQNRDPQALGVVERQIRSLAHLFRVLKELQTSSEKAS